MIAKYEEEGDLIGPLEVIDLFYQMHHQLILIKHEEKGPSWALWCAFCFQKYLDYHQPKVNRAGWHCSWCFRPDGIRKKLLDAPRWKIVFVKITPILTNLPNQCHVIIIMIIIIIFIFMMVIDDASQV